VKLIHSGGPGDSLDQREGLGTEIDPLFSYDDDSDFEEVRQAGREHMHDHLRYSLAKERAVRASIKVESAGTSSYFADSEFESEQDLASDPSGDDGEGRQSARRGKDPIVARVLYWIAGVDTAHMLGQKKERVFYQLLGFSVVLTAMAAVIGMFLFVRLSVPGEWVRDVALAGFWGLIIFWLDRWMVARLSYGPLDETNDGSEPHGPTKWIGYLGRLALGLLLAFTISGPIVLALFQPEIDQQIVVNQTLDKAQSNAQIAQRPDFITREQQIQSTLSAAEALQSSTTAARIDAQKAVDDEISGRGGTGVSGCAAACSQKQQVLRAAQDAEIAATDAATRARATAQQQESALQADIAQATSQSNSSIDSGVGSFARERALFDVLNAHPILYLRWAAISLLLLLVDLMPIVLKLSQSQTLHDRVARLRVVQEAIQSKSTHELRTYRVRDRQNAQLEGIELRSSVAHAINRVKAECYSQLESEEVRLSHQLKLFEIRAYYAQEVRQLQARFGLTREELLDVGQQLLPRQSLDRPRRPLVNGRWILVEPLTNADVGSAGQVHLAHDARSPRGGQKFVVKLVRNRTEDFSVGQNQRAFHQLQNEQLWAIRVRSKFVAPIIDSGFDPSYGPFLVTPHYRETLAKKIRHSGEAPSLEWALRITEQILRGLVDSYNAAGLIHLDIKPANIALDEHDDVRLLDFGLARALNVSAQSDILPQGTRWYAPPEQLTGGNREWPSSACDVRATFAVLYEIITGRPPLYREAVAQGYISSAGQEDPDRAAGLWRLLLTGNPVEPVRLLPRIPAAVNEVIMRGLDRDPLRRTTGPGDLDARNALAEVVALQAGVRNFTSITVGAKAVNEHEGAESGHRDGATSALTELPTQVVSANEDVGRSWKRKSRASSAGFSDQRSTLDDPSVGNTFRTGT
jgi:serine/threonine protein kinase